MLSARLGTFGTYKHQLDIGPAFGAEVQRCSHCSDSVFNTSSAFQSIVIDVRSIPSILHPPYSMCLASSQAQTYWPTSYSV